MLLKPSYSRLSDSILHCINILLKLLIQAKLSLYRVKYSNPRLHVFSRLHHFIQWKYSWCLYVHHFINISLKLKRIVVNIMNTLAWILLQHAKDKLFFSLEKSFLKSCDFFIVCLISVTSTIVSVFNRSAQKSWPNNMVNLLCFTSLPVSYGLNIDCLQISRNPQINTWKCQRMRRWVCNDPWRLMRSDTFSSSVIGGGLSL